MHSLNRAVQVRRVRAVPSGQAQPAGLPPGPGGQPVGPGAAAHPGADGQPGEQRYGGGGLEGPQGRAGCVRSSASGLLVCLLASKYGFT